MRAGHYENVDLNLLLVFEALMLERNVTTAAASIGLTQPTLSHALNRLRRMCGDPLFVRTSRGMQPTAHAESMAEPIRRSLTTIRATLARHNSFDPSKDTRTFRLLLTDIGTVTFLPRLINALRARGPALSVDTVQVPIDTYKDALQDGRAELAIGQMPPISAGFYQRRVFEDEFVCVVGAHHPRIRRAPTLEAYLAEEHIRISLPGRPNSAVDEALAELNHHRRVVATVPQYLAILPILATSDLVAAVPYAVFLAMRRSDELRMCRLPFTPPTIVIRQFWHERNDADAGLTWLRGLINELFPAHPDPVPPSAVPAGKPPRDRPA